VIENDQLYAGHCFPQEQWSVCGVKLKPFSLGHALILQSLDSPFLDFRTPEFEDFMSALWVCSRPVAPHVNTNSIRLPLSWKIGSRLLKKVADKDPLRFWRSIQNLQDYIFESLWFKTPISSKNRQFCRTSTCPALLPMLRAIMNHWGLSYADAINLPFRHAKWMHAGWLEHEGALTFVTQADIDIIKQMMDPKNLEWNQKIRQKAAIRKAAVVSR
jgi:hypothetical protein